MLHFVSNATDTHVLELPSARLSEYDLPDFWESAKAQPRDLIIPTTAAQLVSYVAAAVSQEQQIIAYDRAILAHPGNVVNWYHSMDDASNYFLRFCIFHGICSWEQHLSTSTALLRYDDPLG
jgi:hypothetical protein